MICLRVSFAQGVLLSMQGVLRGRFRLLILIHRQEHGEAGAGRAWLVTAVQAQAAVLFANKLLRNPQSQASAFAFFG